MYGIGVLYYNIYSIYEFYFNEDGVLLFILYGFSLFFINRLEYFILIIFVVIRELFF